MTTQQVSAPFALVPALLAGALTRQGFTALTSVQEAVLDPAMAGKDLRISSQTGSGKTVALGFAIAAELPTEGGEGALRVPAAMVIAPTRELAVQIAKELTWLLQPLGARVCAVTGGTSVMGELRALKQDPRVIVGTPGRLLDHLERGSIDPSKLRVLVLDEADQMLDLGFREALLAIVGKMPAERRTHLVSATFSREVKSLADRYQKQAVQVEGTTLGDANVDIEHIGLVVRSHERDAAIRNLLLLSPTERTLVFVRTRAEASVLADRLCGVGFSACALSGELEQRERTKRLDAFRSGKVLALIATDVAARGLDVPEVMRVIHADPPTDAEVLTHRSGRTGRAGKKGTSVVLVPPQARERVTQMFRRARVVATWRPAPSPADVYRASDERLRTEILASTETPADPRFQALAETLLTAVAVSGADPATLVARLLEGSRHAGPCAPLPISAVEAEPARRPTMPAPQHGSFATRGPQNFASRGPSHAHASPPAHAPSSTGRTPYVPAHNANRGANHAAPARGPAARFNNENGPRNFNDGAPAPGRGFQSHAPVARGPNKNVVVRNFRNDGPSRAPSNGGVAGSPLRRPAQPTSSSDNAAFTPFRVNWGQRDGADPRRLLALLCRRGGVAGNQIGAIRIGPIASTFEVKSDTATEFARAASRPDARDPRVRIAMDA